MTTILNTPPSEKTIVQSDSSGWAVAVFILVLVIGGGLVWYVRYYRAPASESSSAQIQITLPSPSNNSNSDGATRTQ